MGMFDFDDMTNGTVGGAIAGGILGSMFGDTAAEKAVGALAGALIGDYVSDELEDARDSRKVVVVHQPKQPQQQPYPYYQPQSSTYFDTLKCELDRESMMILNSCAPNENKRRSLCALKQRVDNAFYGHKITYHEMNELESFIDSRIKLCDW
jgi:hypothetical protein